MKSVRHTYVDIQTTEDDEGTRVTKVALIIMPPQRIMHSTRMPIEGGYQTNGETAWPIYQDATSKIFLVEEVL